MNLMDQRTSQAPGSTLTDLVAAGGIVVTDEGRARARAKLDAAAERMPPERFAQLRAELGLPPRPATA
jgi:hypothetical protein